jgi:hypothetical protein
MKQQDQYRQVFEMGHERHEKPESVSSGEVLKSFQNFMPLMPQKEGLVRKARSFRSSRTHVSWKSFQNFVPLMPLTGTKARRACSFVIFYMRERSKKVMKTRAIPAPTFPEVI